jgi:ABC-type branched-subunit amino acid transport system substrate-binding protein
VKKFVLAILTNCLWAIFFPWPLYAAPEDLQTPIKIGMSAAFSGPAAELGRAMQQGITIYFKKINATGGIQGRPLVLIALDDKYEPGLAAPNMYKLIEDSQVLAIIGNVGTPTAVVTVPIANQKKVLLFGAYTGAGILRKIPPDRYVINLRASYAIETGAMVKGLLKMGIKPDEIAFFTQNDAYGDSGYNGAINALKESGYPTPENLPYGRYTRNTLNVEHGLVQILQANKNPKAFILVGAYAPIAKFIKLAAEKFPKALFLNISFVGSSELAKNLDNTKAKVIVTQVVPYYRSSLPAAKEYLVDLNHFMKDAKPEFGSFEGYLVAKTFVLSLQKAAAEHQLTREGIINSFEQMQNIDLGIDKPLSYDKNDHVGLMDVWPTVLQNGEFVPFDWSKDFLKIKKEKH